MNTRFICLALAPAVMLALSVSYGQSGDQDHLQGGHHLIGGALSPRWRIGVAQTTATSSVPRFPRRAAPRSVSQGVRHRVPQDYSSIQAAIGASTNGDTVLVSEGTYKENIRYRGKAITVASLYLIDGDTTHIAKTIIDGSSSTQADSGSVVYFINGEDSTSVLCGFTIEGGSGTRSYYPPVWAMVGGGIYCRDAGPRIVRNFITRNRVVTQVAAGGGIEAVGTGAVLPYLILESNRISDNYVENDTSLTNFWGVSGGADIELNARIVGNVFDRDSVVSNSGAQDGGMTFASWNPDLSLATAYISGNVFRANFVSGVFLGAITGGMGVYWTGNVTILNNLFESNKAVCSGSWADGGGLTVDDQGIAGYGRKLILGNQFVNNTVDCPASNYGGAMFFYYTAATVSGNIFRNNGTMRASGGGAGIGIQSSAFRLENNIFSGNSSAADGGALLVNGTPQTATEQAIINNTLVSNRAAFHGGALSANSATTLALLNNILWDDTSSGIPEIYVAGDIAGAAFCDVKGGYAGTGNINADPGFVLGDTMYHLATSSPCVESGIDSTQIADMWYSAPAIDVGALPRPMPAGTRPDIGAQEEQSYLATLAKDVALSRLHARPDVDSVGITAVLANPLHHAAALSAIVVDGYGIPRDSLPLYNDGLHGDGSAGDSIWGCSVRAYSDKGLFVVSIRTDDLTQGSFRRLPNAAAFTTEDSLTLDSLAYSLSIFFCSFRPYIKNTSTDSTVHGVSVHLTCLAPSATTVKPSTTGSTDIPPGGSVNPGTLKTYFNFSTFHNFFQLKFDIAIGGFTCWTDTRSVMVTEIGEGATLPKVYALERNYPNPFNPSTTIQYALPQGSYVTLSVYNTLGQLVSTLVNGEEGAGYHQVKFDGAGLASGVYFYRITAGSFAKAMKMLIIR